MRKSKSGTKKRFKLGSMWIFLIVVVAIILSLVFGNMLFTYLGKSGGQRVFDRYMDAAASQNVSAMADTLYEKGSDEHSNFVERYTQGKTAYEDFIKYNDSESDEYALFMSQSIDEDNPDPRDLGLILAVEQQIAKNISSYTFSSHLEEPFYDEFSVTPVLREKFVDADFPQKYRMYIDDSLSQTFTVKFSNATGDWIFLSSFSLLKKLGEVKTWYAPYSANGIDGLELKYLNPDDLQDGTFGKIFDTTVEVDGKRILSIGSYAFEDCSQMREIIINDSITNIGSYAFKNCTSLNSIVYEDTITPDADRNIRVGKGAFYNCSSLTSYTLPKINTVIPDYLMYNCAKVQEFEIFDTITSIGHNAFGVAASVFLDPSLTSGEKQLMGLKEITIPNSVTSIGDGAFKGQVNLFDITHDENAAEVTNDLSTGSLIRLGANAFNGCESLTKIKLPNSLTKILEGTFYGCASLGEVGFPVNLKEIGASAFAMTALEQLNTLPKSLEIVGSNAFASSALKEVTWPADSRIRVIGARAFYGCSQMFEFTLPNTIRQIGSQAFYGCARLRVVRVFCEGNISVANDSFQYLNSIPKLYVENTAKFTGSNWNYLDIYSQSIIDHDFAITDYVTTNAQGETITETMLVQYLGGLGTTSVDLNEYGIERIGSGAFAYTQYVTEVRFTPGSITAIGENAFVGSKVRFDSYSNADRDTLLYLGNWLVAARNSTGITGANNTLDVTGAEFMGRVVDLASSSNKAGFSGLPVTAGVAAGSFYLVKNLETVYLPSTVEYIGDNAFKNSMRISSVIIAQNSQLKEIGNSAFEGCISLVSFDVPQLVEQIGSRAFLDCDSLRFVIVNNGDGTRVGTEVFVRKEEMLKVYVNNFSLEGSLYQTDLNWAEYSEFIYDASIITSDNKFALEENEDGTYRVIQYLGLETQNNPSNINLSTSDATINSGMNVASSVGSAVITSIDTSAFATSNIASVIIPYTVKEIGDYAFFRCRVLLDVTLLADGDENSSLVYIGDFSFSQTNLNNESAKFRIHAASPNQEFKMGENVFDNNVNRAVEVDVRVNYAENEYWKGFAKTLSAEDDPSVSIRIEVDGSTLLHENSVGRLSAIGNINNENHGFTEYYGAPLESMPFSVTVDTARGYVFKGWYAYNSQTNQRGEFISADLNRNIVLSDQPYSKQFYIAVFVRKATVVNPVYFKGSTEAMGSISVTSSTAKNGNLIDLYEDEALTTLATITLLATANEGYRFYGWFVNGVLVSSEEEYIRPIGEDLKIEAMFEPDQD